MLVTRKNETHQRLLPPGTKNLVSWTKNLKIVYSSRVDIKLLLLGLVTVWREANHAGI